MDTKIVKSIGVGILCAISPWSTAQCLWHNPDTCHYPVMQNQGFIGKMSSMYQRLPQEAKAQVRPEVWQLSTNSAGLALCFETDAQEIRVRYQVSGGYSMPHMPATGVSGVDLYQTEGKAWNICYGNYQFGDTIQYTYLIKEASARTHSYCLYLPLYAGVKWMEIGVPEKAQLQFRPSSEERPIVVYGTSIAQGACASRPGMAWTNLLHRTAGCPVVNFGFSGNGKLEKNVLSYIRELDARLFVLDCMANLPDEPEDTITARLVDAVLYLREKSEAPILFVEHAGYSNAPTNTHQFWRYDHTNRASREAYRLLKEKGVPHLLYLSHEELGLDPDSWVDYVHPSDYGMKQQAEAVWKKIKDLPGIGD